MKPVFGKFAGVTLAITALSPVAQAQSRQFPFVAPYSCPNSIVQRPEGASPFYRSEDCNTIFVLPPQMGSLEYTVNTASANDEDCDDLKSLRQDKRTLYQRIQQLNQAIAQPNLSADRLAVLERQLEILNRQLVTIETSHSNMAGTEGAIMDVKLASNFSEEVNRFQSINQLLFALGTRFENAPIAESYVSFDAGAKEGRDTRAAVIRTSVPGVEVRGIRSAPNSDSRIMNGAVSGTVYLGLNAICNMRDQQGATKIARTDFGAAKMEAFMPANLTYSVPVLSSYHYVASMDFEMVVRDLFKQWEVRPDQFTVNATKDWMIRGAGRRHIKWEFNALELQDRGVTSAELQELEARERDAVFAAWARELSDIMVQMGILKAEAPTPIPAPAAGTVAETFYREVCQSKSFLGMRYSHHCWEEPYSVVRVKAGTADNVVDTVKSLRLDFRQEVTYRQPIYRTHTSTFRYVKKN